MPFGRRFWAWGGRGNPFPFCRNFPWLPRWWWAMPNAYQYGLTLPSMGYGYPYYGGSYPRPQINPYMGYGYPYQSYGYPYGY